MRPAEALAALAAAAKPRLDAAEAARVALDVAVRASQAQGGFVARVEDEGLRIVASVGAEGPPPARRLSQVADTVREARAGVVDAPPRLTGGSAPEGAVAVRADAGHPPVHAFAVEDPGSGTWFGVLALIPDPAAPAALDDAAVATVTVVRRLLETSLLPGLSGFSAAPPGERPALRHSYEEIVTCSPKVHDVLRLLDRVIGAKVPVLICGETGTGKELIARAIHRNDPQRRRKRFYTQNCAAIPGSLLESELFGYEKGAFTGAEKRKEGLFEIASGSTLFLDEIAEMSLDMQARLLRVLQEGEVVPLGSAEPVTVDVRIVAATHRDLEQGIRTGRFRQDLYYRLKVVRLNLPPLRERPEDIPVLVEHFLRKTARETGRPPKVLDRRDPRLGAALTRHAWPGNIRELENFVRRLVYLADEVITYDALVEADTDSQLLGGDDADPPATRPVRNLDDVVAEVELREIENALRVTQGNRTQAAALLGINRRSLLRRLQKYGDPLEEP